MNESVLRWKGRLGSLKAVAVFVLIFAAIFLILAISDLSVATNNPTEPEEVPIGDLVSGDVGTSRYISISGTAIYPAAYEETEDGRTVAEYYFVVDQDAGAVALVKAADTLPLLDDTAEVTVFGLTHSTASKLRDLVESDVPDINSNGFDINTGLYLGENEKPVSVAQQTSLVIGMGVLVALCVATFFFPGTVFAPRPPDPLAAPAATGGDAGVKASGRFLKLNSIRPTIQIGKGTRNFTNAIANVIPLENRKLMVYIHHIMTYKTYGVTVRKVETDWGIFVDSGNIVDIEPGKIYSWRDRWAVRLRYKDAQEKQQTALVSFNHAGAQADFVNLLRQSGFTVGTGEPTFI